MSETTKLIDELNKMFKKMDDDWEELQRRFDPRRMTLDQLRKMDAPERFSAMQARDEWLRSERTEGRRKKQNEASESRQSKKLIDKAWRQ
jgi:hypothetical protein